MESDRLSAFEFPSFNEFESAIDDVLLRLFNQGNPQSCAGLYGSAPTFNSNPNRALADSIHLYIPLGYGMMITIPPVHQSRNSTVYHACTVSHFSSIPFTSIFFPAV